MDILDMSTIWGSLVYLRLSKVIDHTYYTHFYLILDTDSGPKISHSNESFTSR